jgi:predicted house-cleaning noncanonical NTP pyrophosphatase (MazG superfamily)
MKYYRFKAEKIVPDNTMKCLHERNRGDASCRILTDGEYKKELLKKMMEESLEVQVADCKEEYINEISDLLDVIDSLKKNMNISDDEILKTRESVKDIGGLFNNKIYLEYFDLAEDDQYLQKYLDDSIKYPIIKIYEK